jgi:hypothetical protein
MFIPVAPDEVILLRCRDIRLTTVVDCLSFRFFFYSKRDLESVSGQ